jgi:cytochrome c peroxidase
MGTRTASLRFPAGATAGANDQIQCVLRAVGTFPSTGTMPILPSGSPVVIREVRTNMMTDAQGLSGFNPPSLLDGVAGAPYFHAGNARTLEEVFDPAFEAHYQALSENFLLAGDRATQIRQIVAFLLSIDEDTAAVAAPTLGYSPLLCPTSL